MKQIIKEEVLIPTNLLAFPLTSPFERYCFYRDVNIYIENSLYLFKSRAVLQKLTRIFRYYLYSDLNMPCRIDVNNITNFSPDYIIILEMFYYDNISPYGIKSHLLSNIHFLKYYNIRQSEQTLTLHDF